MSTPHITKAELLAVLPPQILRSQQVAGAIAITEDAHNGQLRDDGSTYLEGHIWVLAAQIYQHYENGSNLEKLLIASLLHDVVEDAPQYSIEFIGDQFGQEMANIITALTKKPEEDTAQTPAGKFQDTKQYLARLATHGEIAIRIKLEDRIANLRSIVSDNNPNKLAKYQRQVKEAEELYMPLAKDLSGEPNYVELLQTEIERINRFLPEASF